MRRFIPIILLLFLFSCDPHTQRSSSALQTSAIVSVNDGLFLDEGDFKARNTCEVFQVGSMKYIIFSKGSWDGGVHVSNYTLDSLKVESLKK